MLYRSISLIIVATLSIGAFLFFFPTRDIAIEPGSGGESPLLLPVLLPDSHSLPDFQSSASTTTVAPPLSFDIPDQQPLPNPPKVVKALYSTSWSAGSAKKRQYLLDVMRRAGLNGIVIDIKDYSGYVAYRTQVSEVRESGAEGEVRILYPNMVIKQLHDAGIYVIGRISVFQDPVLARAHPEWALKNSATGKPWTDRQGLQWLDPAAKPVWEYAVALAKDARRRGFDEINFDYIRFPSDGNLSVIQFPFWDSRTPRHAVMRQFFEYLHEQLGDATISADLFGLATVNSDDLGIGQIIEDAYPNFDYISPMVYPSHYHPGFLGYKNPAEHPYEVVKYSLEKALARLENYESQIINNSSTESAQVSSSLFNVSGIRPWLQAFDLGATYDAPMVQKQIRAVEEVLASGSSTDRFSGWLLWDPSNNYASL